MQEYSIRDKSHFILSEGAKKVVKKQHLAIIGLIFISILTGIAYPFVTEKIQYIIILTVPTILICFFIIRNPYNGIYLFFLYTYFRPFELIPALGALRLTMLIEIVTLGAWLLRLMMRKENIKWSTFSWYYLGFVGVIGVTVFTAEIYYFAYQTFLEMLVNFIIFVIAINVVDSKARIRKLIWLFLVIHIYFSIKGIMNFVTGSHFVETAGQYTSGQVSGGYIGDENDFALAINMMIPFAFFGIFYFKKALKSISVVFTIILVLAVISSFSRGGLVGLVCLLFYCILSTKRKMLSFGIVASIVAAMIAFAPSSYWKEVETIGEGASKGTAHARIQFWKAAGRMFIDYPVIGVGANNAGAHMPVYLIDDREPGNRWGQAIHGTFPQIAAELGTLGLFFYISMIIVAFKLLFRIKNQKTGEGGNNFSQYLANSVIGSLIAYFACATFLSTAYYPHLWTIYAFAIILLQIHNRSIREPSQD
jgi:probable O-glycosylation ligase (exosortase A-associated)